MSRLEEISKTYREQAIARNDHNKNDQYSSTHPDALSDGDEMGKGEKNGSIGSKTDIEQRQLQKARNKFSANNPYDDSSA